jgi:probable rRNA maturation factor
MGLKLEIQKIYSGDGVPDKSQFNDWVNAALAGDAAAERELTIRIVDEAECAELNQTYRKKNGSTNVLSFMHEDPPGVSTGILGDLVICAPVIRREAMEQNKTLPAHWAHMVVHGVLHLTGHDHEEAEQAEKMESLETEILTGLGFDRPYE